MEHARSATTDDIADLVALARQLRDELTQQRGGLLWATREVAGEPLEVAFANALSSPETMVVVGTIDGVAVGYGLVTIEVLRDGSRLGCVHELFVEPAARGVGVGEAIANEVLARCRAERCRGVDVIALPGHRAAKNFFEEQGFIARAIVMHHQLDDEP
ncbi:MAG TPA: GNAT family N-acetyltransferase [Acidimicrobiia bacterium]